jgi:hypothetical protein
VEDHVMSDWLCIKCFHEFPDEGVKRQPEYVGMALFVLIGAGLLLFALGGVYAELFVRHSLDVAVYSGLAAVFGAGAISMGMQFRKGVKAICPVCGKPQGVPADSKVADEMRQRQAKKQAH